MTVTSRRPVGTLALGERQAGALAAEDLLAGRHQGAGRHRHQRRQRRQRHLGPDEPPDRLQDRQVGRHATSAQEALDEVNDQRQAGPHDPDHRRQAGFKTRSGIKVIIEKFAESSGWTPRPSASSRATRSTTTSATSSRPSGSPTPVSSCTPPPGRSAARAHANVSHGCVGMSIDNGRLALQPDPPRRSRRGDRHLPPHRARQRLDRLGHVVQGLQDGLRPQLAPASGHVIRASGHVMRRAVT